MSSTRSEHRRHRWADIVVILASVYAIVAAAWFPPEMVSGGGSEAVGHEGWVWAAYALAGGLGLAGLFAAHRWPTAGKVAVGAAGLVMLSGFLGIQRATLLAVLSIGGTGLALLAAAAFVGPMPTPEQEGKRRDPDIGESHGMVQGEEITGKD